MDGWTLGFAVGAAFLVVVGLVMVSLVRVSKALTLRRLPLDLQSARFVLEDGDVFVYPIR